MLNVLIILLVTVKSYGFLDFVGAQAKQAMELAAYVDAAAELSSEVMPDEDLKSGAKDIQKRAENLRSDASNLKYISRSTKSVLEGPDWSSRRLETNIRATTDYIRRLKSLIAKSTILGTQGTIALNTTETNVALTEVQKNQQALIMQNADAQLRDLEKEQEEAKQWSAFSTQQRKVRQKESQHGKL